MSNTNIIANTKDVTCKMDTFINANCRVIIISQESLYGGAYDIEHMFKLSRSNAKYAIRNIKFENDTHKRVIKDEVTATAMYAYTARRAEILSIEVTLKP